jgi:hypothetical protein
MLSHIVRIDSSSFLNSFFHSSFFSLPSKKRKEKKEIEEGRKRDERERKDSIRTKRNVKEEGRKREI